MSLASKGAAGIVVSNPEVGADKWYMSQILPFRAASSVYNFKQCARAIQCIGDRLLSLIWTHFSDHYPQLSWQAEMDKAQADAEGLCDLLGWRLSAKPAKRPPFAESFDLHRIVVDFSQAGQINIAVRSKPDTIESLQASVADINHWPSCLSPSQLGLEDGSVLQKASLSPELKQCSGQPSRPGHQGSKVALLTQDMAADWISR